MSQPCEKYQEWMIASLGGEPRPSLSAELKAHLEACTGCSGMWRDFAEIRRGMEQLESQEQPSELSVARILKAAEKKLPAKPPSSRFWRVLLSRPAQVAAMMVLIIGVGIYTQKWLKTHRGPMAPFQGPVYAPLPALPEAAPPPPAPTLEQQRQDAEKAKIIEEKKMLERSRSESAAKAKAAIQVPKSLDRPIPPAQPGALGGSTTTGAPAGASRPSLDAGIMAPAERFNDAKGAEEKPMTEPAKPATPPVQDKSLQMTAPMRAAPIEKEAADADSRAKQDAPSGPTQAELLASAKEKIRAGNCTGALPELLRAQKLGDYAEIGGLIEFCRNRLKPEMVPAR